MGLFLMFIGIGLTLYITISNHAPLHVIILVAIAMFVPAICALGSYLEKKK